jgi:DNA-binding CsgD family transcriptional regulator
MGKPEPDTIRLSQRQAQVVVLSAKSLSKATICGLLGIKKSTLESHLVGISEKIGASSRPELTMLALAMGWIDNPYDGMAPRIKPEAPPGM